MSHLRFSPGLGEEFDVELTVDLFQDFSGTSASYQDIVNALRWMSKINFKIITEGYELKVPALVSWNSNDGQSFEVRVNLNHKLLFNSLIIASSK